MGQVAPVPCCDSKSGESTAPPEVAEAISVVPQSYGALVIAETGGIFLANVHLAKQVEVTRSGPLWRTIGLLVRPGEDEHLHVDEVVAPSLISTWNDKEGDVLKKVRKGDKVVAINGERTVDGMLRVLQASRKGSVLRFEML
mmetsp:Transcript_123894/g.385813  ORF Transcript_123894/g.385813 Transcript_123894/m.385813 type:complete len:142 (-) Transcript_123894:144-569(-)